MDNTGSASHRKCLSIPGTCARCPSMPLGHFVDVLAKLRP